MSPDFTETDLRLGWEERAIEFPLQVGRQLSHTALSSAVSPVDLPSRWSFRASEKKRPLFAISVPETSL